MRGNIDRLSEGYFVVIMEDDSIKHLKQEKYPNLKTGQIINIEEDLVLVDEEATKILRNKIITLQNKLFK